MSSVLKVKYLCTREKQLYSPRVALCSCRNWQTFGPLRDEVNYETTISCCAHTQLYILLVCCNHHHCSLCNLNNDKLTAFQADGWLFVVEYRLHRWLVGWLSIGCDNSRGRPSLKQQPWLSTTRWQWLIKLRPPTGSLTRCGGLSVKPSLRCHSHG